MGPKKGASFWGGLCYKKIVPRVFLRLQPMYPPQATCRLRNPHLYPQGVFLDQGSQPDTTYAVIWKQWFISNDRNRVRWVVFSSHRIEPASVYIKISAWIASRETYLMLPLSTHLFSHYQIQIPLGNSAKKFVRRPKKSHSPWWLTFSFCRDCHTPWCCSNTHHVGRSCNICGKRHF